MDNRDLGCLAHMCMVVLLIILWVVLWPMAIPATIWYVLSILKKME